MEKNKVALAIIAKDKADIITRMLDSTKGVFSIYCLQDTGSSDDTVELFESWCKLHNKEYYSSKKFVGKDYKEVIVDGKPTLGDFASARNDAFALIPKGIKWAFWTDTDDIGVNFEQIPALVEYCNVNNLDSIIMVYDYAKPVNGIKPVTQQRERLINLEKKGEWKNRVHENYALLEASRVELLSNTPFRISIQHERTPNEALATNRRNNLIMKAQLEEDGIDNFPDEMLNHLAYDCWEHQEWEESIKFYKILLDRWQGKQVGTEVVYMVLMNVGKAYFSLSKFDESVKYGMQGMSIIPKYPDAFLLLAQVFGQMGNIEESDHYADKVIQIGKPQTIAPVNEFDYVIVPLQIKFSNAMRRNDLRKAQEYLAQLRSIMPTHPIFIKDWHTINKLKSKEEAIMGINSLIKYYQENNQMKNLEKIKRAIPVELLDDDQIRQKIKEIVYDSKKSIKTVFKPEYEKTIVFYAGQGYEDWDGESDVKKGIGGSEGMCIQLARELAAIGNKVFVYTSCGSSDGKVFDGVTYIDYKKWDSKQKCDIFISLRRPDVFQTFIKATKKFLWLHDTEYGEVPMINFTSPNKVIVLTEFHKDIIKQNHGIDDDSIFWITRNGLNEKALAYADKNAGKRNPYQLIYGSSYDRGLNNLLAMWPRIKKAVPQATLKIFYGWDTMDKMIQMWEQRDPQRAQSLKIYKSQIMQMISQLDGVQELGRVSQEELYKHFKESNLWVYPTEFQEISCITAMSAQALGAIPVCTPYAALNETVNSKYGVKVTLDKFADAVIYQLQHPEEVEKKREPMMEWARKEYSMKELAKEWDDFLNKD